MKSDLISGFGAKLYRVQSALFGLNAIHRKALSLISLKKGETLLDVGCGNGKILFDLYKVHGKDVALFGIDGSSDMLEIAGEQNEIWGKPVKFKRAYAEDIPYESNKFDVVTSTLTAHHLPEEEKRKMVTECARVLKSGGTLLISDFGRPKGVLGKSLAFFTNTHSYTRGNMHVVERELLRNGFVIEKRERQFGYVEHLLALKPKDESRITN